MSTAAPDSTHPHLKILYWVLGVIAIGLTIYGVATYGAQKQTERANQLAAELTAKYESAGLTAPPLRVITRTLGDDGGNICENPANALGVALINDQLTNGGSQVGRRPVIADTTSLQGEKLIIETYCPDELEDFRDALADYKTDDTVKE